MAQPSKDRKRKLQFAKPQTSKRLCSATTLVTIALFIFMGGVMLHNRSLNTQLATTRVDIMSDRRLEFLSHIIPLEPEPTLPPDAHQQLSKVELKLPKSVEKDSESKLPQVETPALAMEKEDSVVVGQVPSPNIEETSVEVDPMPPLDTELKSSDKAWFIDPYGADHARVHAGASGSLLAAMRRHHLIHDFVDREPSWYTDQTCEHLLEYFADVLPRSRNLIKTMEYSLGNLKEQVTDLLHRNDELDNQKEMALEVLPTEIGQALWPEKKTNRRLLSWQEWDLEFGKHSTVGRRRGLLKFGRPKRKDGVRFDEKKQLWSATILIGKTLYGLGNFKTQALAQAAVDREANAAKKLGYGAIDAMTGSCEAKLKKTYLQIHEVMLDSRDLDIATATLRTRIALAHDRNRVLERWSELSPAALSWVSSPLTGQSSEDLEDARSSRITNLVVIKVIDAWQARRRLELEGKVSSQRKELVFPPVPAPCSEDYIAQRKANHTYLSFNHKCKTPETLRKEHELHGSLHDPRFPNYMHFVHIPKAGGTSFTKVLRRMTCTKNGASESTLDCCAVGWCDWQKGITCQNIHGCTNHIPRIGKWLNKPLPSITMMRDPATRFISAWHYRCHHPNYDCFGVRKQFKEVRSGKARKFTFDEYCQMPEYQNIMIKMFVKDKFPYGDYGTLTNQDLEKGKQNLDKFVFVGMNEMYDTSMVLLADALDLRMTPADFDKERSANRPTAYRDFMQHLHSNATLQEEINKANEYDIGLYHHGRKMFCEQLRKSPALIHPMLDIEIDKRNVCLDLWK